MKTVCRWCSSCNSMLAQSMCWWFCHGGSVWSVVQDSVLLPGLQDGYQYWILCMCIFTLPDCTVVFFCMCWGQARHSPRKLINGLCHKLVPLVFICYNRNGNIIPYGSKNAVRELKEFLVSVCVGDSFYKKDCHNTWTTVTVFLDWLWVVLGHLKHSPDGSEVCSVFISDSRRMGGETTVTETAIIDPWM